MKALKNKKINYKSTYDRMASNSKTKARMEEDYAKLLLSEMFLTLIEKDGTSVRELAKELHLSPATIQNLKTDGTSIRLETLLKVIKRLGASLKIEKDGKVLATI